MPQDLLKNIENHLATFPERHQDFLEMRTEWKEFKTRAMWTMISFIGAILSIGIWVGTMQAGHQELEDNTIQAKVDIKALEARTNMLEVNNSEIRARLVSIEVTLQEIKAAIIKLQ
jgi:hypothetical protein